MLAGTPLIGHTLEYLLQQGQGPKLAADAQHLAAARDAGGFPRFQHLLWRPLLLDALEWVQRELCEVEHSVSVLDAAREHKFRVHFLRWLQQKVQEVDKLVASLQELAAPT